MGPKMKPVLVVNGSFGCDLKKYTTIVISKYIGISKDFCEKCFTENITSIFRIFLSDTFGYNFKLLVIGGAQGPSLTNLLDIDRS